MADTLLIVLAACIGSITGIFILVIGLFIYISYKRSRKYKKMKDEPNSVYDYRRRQSIPDAEDGFALSEFGDDQSHEAASYIPDLLPVTFVCVKDFTPKKKGDINLHAGDIVSYHMTFTDGMCVGNNHTTGEKGVFPFSYVKSNNFETESNRRSSIDSHGIDLPPLAPEGEGRLLFSMVPQDQAMEIINTSLPEERRKEYFETKSSISSSSSFEKLSLPSDSPMPRLKKPPSKALLNWDKLRTNWKDAVRVELQTSFEKWEAKRNQAKFWQLLVDNYRIE
ncbi:hypothetical protein HDV01_000508 [Terramyces sp. JEL0728]|nr:hypothetical protein HDV01_000508 [Terramyces sp. JEL0728]